MHQIDGAPVAPASDNNVLEVAAEHVVLQNVAITAEAVSETEERKQEGHAQLHLLVEIECAGVEARLLAQNQRMLGQIVALQDDQHERAIEKPIWASALGSVSSA